MKQFNIQHNVCSPYHLQSNGLTERYNQTLVNCLVNFVNEEQNYWDIYVDPCLSQSQPRKRHSSLPMVKRHACRSKISYLWENSMTTCWTKRHSATALPNVNVSGVDSVRACKIIICQTAKSPGKLQQEVVAHDFVPVTSKWQADRTQVMGGHCESGILCRTQCHT